MIYQQWTNTILNSMLCPKTNNTTSSKNLNQYKMTQARYNKLNQRKRKGKRKRKQLHKATLSSICLQSLILHEQVKISS